MVERGRSFTSGRRWGEGEWRAGVGEELHQGNRVGRRGMAGRGSVTKGRR